MLRHAASRAFARATSSNVAAARPVSTLTQILDGSIWQLKSRKGKLVGEDELGNKYYENMNYQSGRHRWVEYKNIENYDYSASSIPREWHGWLHHVDDEPGLSARTAPAYEVKFIPGGDTTGVPDKMYVPKGHFLNKRGIKNWKRYTPWSPP